MSETFLWPIMYRPKMGIVKARKLGLRSKIFLFSKTEQDNGNRSADICLVMQALQSQWANSTLHLSTNNNCFGLKKGEINWLKKMIWFYLMAAHRNFVRVEEISFQFELLPMKKNLFRFLVRKKSGSHEDWNREWDFATSEAHPTRL